MNILPITFRKFFSDKSHKKREKCPKMLKTRTKMCVFNNFFCSQLIYNEQKKGTLAAPFLQSSLQS